MAINIKNQEDVTTTKIAKSDGDTSSSTKWEVQQAWDKHSSFIQAQSRAMKTLESMIKQYAIAVDTLGIYVTVATVYKTMILNKTTLAITTQSVALAANIPGLVVNDDYLYIALMSTGIKKLNKTTLVVLATSGENYVTTSSVLSDSLNFLAYSNAQWSGSYYGVGTFYKSTLLLAYSINVGSQNPPTIAISEDEKFVFFSIATYLYKEPINASTYTHYTVMRASTSLAVKLKVVGDFVFALVTGTNFSDVIVYSVNALEDKKSASLAGIINSDPANGGVLGSAYPTDFEISKDEKTLFVVNPKGFHIIPIAYIVDKYLKV